MIDRNGLEMQLAELPLLSYFWIEPGGLEFTERVRTVCRQECPMYGKTWACPPAVGTVAQCAARCGGFSECLVIATAAEVADITDLKETLASREPHEQITDQVRDLLREQGSDPYVLSTEACAICERCAWLEGEPCRFPEKMHPCVESHGINLIPVLEENGLDFQFGSNVVTWVSLLFC